MMILGTIRALDKPFFSFKNINLVPAQGCSQRLYHNGLIAVDTVYCWAVMQQALRFCSHSTHVLISLYTVMRTALVLLEAAVPLADEG